MSPTAPTTADRQDEDQRFPYWRQNMYTVSSANVVCSLGMAMALPFLPLMMRGLGVTEHLGTWVGYTMLAFYFAGVVSQPVWGSVADHYGRKIMVLRAMMGVGCCMLLVPLAPSPLWFAGLFMLIGIFTGFTPAGMALIAANTPPKRLGGALSMAQSGYLIGATLGPAVGGALMAVLDHQHRLFWVGGGLELAGGLLVILFAREVRQVAQGPWRPEWLGSLRQLWAVPQIAALLVLSFMFSVLWHGNTTILSLFTLQLIDEASPAYGSEAFWVAAVAMGLALASVIAMPLWGRVLDRYPPVRLMTFTAALAVLASVPLIFVQTPLQLTIARVVFGLGAVAMQPAIARLMREYSPRGMDARAISYGSSFQLMAMGLAPFCAGMVAPVLGLRAYFALVILLGIASLAFWIARTRLPQAT